MRIGITGTYSSGKTTTSIAVAHLTGIPRVEAKTMRELLPHAVPGKQLSECTSAEYIQLVVRRHVERATHEKILKNGFISDGCSLQELAYGTLRVAFGMNPTEEDRNMRPFEGTNERSYYAEVFRQLGIAYRDHVKTAFDVFVHLSNELTITNDGHRPMNNQFRKQADEFVLEGIKESGVPYVIISGDVRSRLEMIVNELSLPTVITIEDALKRTTADYAEIDIRLELER
jgi:hypothetical protein